MKKILISILIGVTAMTTSVSMAEDNSLICLAKNIYHEAKGEPLAGKLAVAKVTINRVKSGYFASTICGVVYERGQFSWTTDRRLKVRDKEAWQESVDIARHSLKTGLDDVNLSALYFHNTSVKPRWNKKRIAKIGNHVFYK